MKRTALTAMMTMAMAASGLAGHNAPAAGPSVTVCLDSPLAPADVLAPYITTAIFAHVGVRLEWRDDRHCPAGALRISLAIDTPSDLLPGALAYAMPYEGTHIVVFLDRVRATVERNRVPVLLGHVFAHEITHILQGCSRHSESGLMKAHWNSDDFREMTWKTMPFTPPDIELIHLGLANRVAAASPREYHSVTERPGDPR